MKFDLESDIFDLIIVGGGINGTGVARDAALRGMRVLLLEKNDFGAGTSAHSSRLIHGGLRYLAHLEFDLVYESLRERERLLRNAPHLVKPLAMAIPLYPGAKNPPVMVRLGMLLYDLLSWGKHMPPHHMLNREEFLRMYPAIQSDDLLGGPVYYDAQVDFPERLCLENALSAQEIGNAVLMNHTRLIGIQCNEASLPQVTFRDELTGQNGTATGRALINASGPWVDALLKEGGLDLKRPLIGGTKGSHIVIRRFPGGPETAIYAEAQSDGRPFFIIPWRERYYLIGTTDEHFEGNLDHPAATWREVDYLLAETNAILPTANLTEQDVLYTYAGIRPLPYSRETAGKVTRRHLIHDHRAEGFPRFFSLIGGKLTTYRSLSAQAVDTVIRRCRLKQANQARWPKSRTQNLPLPGGRGIDDLETYRKREIPLLSEKYDVPPDVVAHLIKLYGSRVEAVLTLCLADPRLKQPLTAEHADIQAQVVYAAGCELAKTLADVILRRLEFGLSGDFNREAVQTVARLMVETLGWSEERRQAEVESYYQLIQQTALAFKQ